MRFPFGSEEDLILMKNMSEVQARAFQRFIQLLQRGLELIIRLDSSGCRKRLNHIQVQ